MNTDVKQTREKIVEFVTKSGGIADRSVIKEHLGLDGMTYYEFFEKALKTTRLKPIYGTGQIGKNLFVTRRPIVAYRLSK